MTSYVAQYAAARKAAADARAALDTAHKHVEPPTAELHALFLTKPEGYADCLRKMAAIVDTLPTLTKAVEETAAAEAELAEQECWHCHGTGLYQAPTSYFQNGKPQCWKCGGTGLSAAARKAAA